MKQAQIRIHRQLEDIHWWFVGRRHVLRQLLARLADPGDGFVLEVGCGTGGNLTWLAGRGYRAVGLEPNVEMAAAARRKSGCKVYDGDLAGALGGVREDVRVILLMDVLEHIEHDLDALRLVHEWLPPGGRLVVTVPAAPFLWGYHDEAFGHRRRYTMRTLRRRLDDAGFGVLWLSHFVALLFPLAVFVRLLTRFLATGGKRTDFVLPPRLLNDLLTQVLALESLLVGRMACPFGLSLQAVAIKGE